MRRIQALVLVLLLEAPALAHRGAANPQTWSACDEAVLGDTCSFVDHHDDLHRGTCRLASGRLGCVRNKPLVPAASVQADASARLGGLGVIAVFGGLSLLAFFTRNSRFPFWRNS